MSEIHKTREGLLGALKVSPTPDHYRVRRIEHYDELDFSVRLGGQTYVFSATENPVEHVYGLIDYLNQNKIPAKYSVIDDLLTHPVSTDFERIDSDAAKHMLNEVLRVEKEAIELDGRISRGEIQILPRRKH